ncbi:MAG: extracellular solute-binding protein [Caldilineaceae bacterium]|nr:extracellular solute-binding protein [Caldilineaceae bacterium]MCB0141203.1 extracellular solute-binding protein [Caldilineaceae bacterium]
MRKHISLFSTFALMLALLLSACAAPAAAPADSSGGDSAAAPTEAPAEAAASSDDVFTYWGGLIFSDAANQMLVDRVTQWGEERGVKTEVVMINQNETVQRVSAAIEAGAMPDALDVGRGFMLLLTQQDQLEPIDDLYNEIGDAVGGWLPAADEATSPDRYGGHRYGIPFSLGGNVLYRRVDVLEPAGFTEAPQTWNELYEMAKAAQNPPDNYGMGFALSNVGDGNLTTTMLQSWGGRVADDEGANCTLDSQEVRDFLTWITTAYGEGLFPPGATTWDGAGDNVAYQSGNAVFIANPGSVYLYMRDEDPDLGNSTKYSALPAGPAMRIAPVDANVRVIPKSSGDMDLAKDLLKYLADPEFMKEYYYNAIYGPAAVGYQDAPIFTEGPVHVGLLDLALNGTFGAFPDVDNAAFAEYQTNFLTPRMIQRVVVDGLSVDDAVAETQQACQDIYDKYK